MAGAFTMDTGQSNRAPLKFKKKSFLKGRQYLILPRVPKTLAMPLSKQEIKESPNCHQNIQNKIGNKFHTYRIARKYQLEIEVKQNIFVIFLSCRNSEFRSN
jgi:hypothetical protein